MSRYFTSCVKFFERLELLNERLVLVLEHGDSVLKTLDVLLLLPPENQSEISIH